MIDIAHLQKGDVLTVAKLSDASRSSLGVVSLMVTLRERGIGFKAQLEGVDTTTRKGRLWNKAALIVKGFLEDVAHEKSQRWIQNRRAYRPGGRPKALTPVMMEAAEALIREGVSITKVALQIGVSRPTLYRAVAQGDSYFDTVPKVHQDYEWDHTIDAISSELSRTANRRSLARSGGKL